MTADQQSGGQSRQDQAEQIAMRTARKELPPNMEYKTTMRENDQAWIFTILPVARVRGGGMQVTVSKKDLKVIDVVHLQ